MLINVAKIIDVSRVNGPGIRSVIWVQGCPNDCHGCFNQSFRPFIEAHIYSIQELYEIIIKNKNKYQIEGVTYSGGEPFAQAEGLYYLSKMLKEEGLNILCYSGFKLGQLKNENNPFISKLLSEIDILIDGPYIKELHELKFWRGSSNQKLHLLSNAIDRSKIFSNEDSEIEFHIDKFGNITITGTFDKELMDYLKEKL